jgi:hypothetical protein
MLWVAQLVLISAAVLPLHAHRQHRGECDYLLTSQPPHLAPRTRCGGTGYNGLSWDLVFRALPLPGATGGAFGCGRPHHPVGWGQPPGTTGQAPNQGAELTALHHLFLVETSWLCQLPVPVRILAFSQLRKVPKSIKHQDTDIAFVAGTFHRENNFFIQLAPPTRQLRVAVLATSRKPHISLRDLPWHGLRQLPAPPAPKHRAWARIEWAVTLRPQR